MFKLPCLQFDLKVRVVNRNFTVSYLVPNIAQMTCNDVTTEALEKSIEQTFTDGSDSRY
jgi:hypothetical protein